MSKSLQKKLFFAYLIALPLFVLVVNKALKADPVTLSELEAEKTAVEVKPLSVTVDIVGSKYQGEYTVKLTNRDTVVDALEDLRKNDQFYYEIVESINELEILVDDTKELPPFKWRVFKNNTDITNNIEEYYLEDGATYQLKRI